MYDTTRNTPLKVLEVAASGRNDGSVSRMLSADLIGALEERHGTVALTRRDLNKGLPFVDDAWINANFTAPEERSAGQRAALAESDALVAELKAADVLVIGSPIYNFGACTAYVSLHGDRSEGTARRQESLPGHRLRRCPRR
jgi:FMN-dependent NADH-azoreductase